MELLYRDEFGVHDRGEAPAVPSWLRVARRIKTELVRPRRFSPEVALWTAIIVLLVLFVAVLITGESTVARGGR